MKPKWPKVVFFIVDEDIQTKIIKTEENFLFPKKGIKDNKIIDAIKIFANPFVIFTKNYKHYKNKLDLKKDKVVKLPGQVSSDFISQYLPRAKDKIQRMTTFSRHKAYRLSVISIGEKESATLSAIDGTKKFPLN